MTDRKSYGQFCGLARSLDHVGDRWTLLVVRELLSGPQTFRGLQAGLAGINPTLLSGRLEQLLRDSLITRSDAPRRSKAVVYALTPAGRELEPAILALISWGTRWMTEGPGTDLVDPSWSVLALRAILLAEPATVDGIVHVNVSGQCLTITARGGSRTITPGHHGDADAWVDLDLPQVLAVAAGRLRLRSTPARIRGRARVAARLLEPA